MKWQNEREESYLSELCKYLNKHIVCLCIKFTARESQTAWQEYETRRRWLEMQHDSTWH